MVSDGANRRSVCAASLPAPFALLGLLICPSHTMAFFPHTSGPCTLAPFTRHHLTMLIQSGETSDQEEVMVLTSSLTSTQSLQFPLYGPFITLFCIAFQIKCSPCILACLILIRPLHCVFPSDGIHITFPWSVPKFPVQKPAEARPAQRMGDGSWGEVLGHVGTVAD